MKSAPPAQINYLTLYRQAIGQTQSVQLRNQLAAVEADVLAAGTNYDAAMHAAGPHAIVPEIALAGLQDELRGLYGRRVQSRTGSCRWLYDKLFSSLSHCPYCEYGEIYELDHFLPQSVYYDVSIYPKNLVPVCHPCNHKKLQKQPNGSGTYFLHPYFDQLPNIPWLFAAMSHEDGGPVLSYRVHLDQAVYGDLAQRLSYHFRELALNERMKRLSSKILIEMETYVREALLQFNPAGISAHFASEADRILRTHGNTIEAAANRAASENDDYCSGQYFS